MRFFKEKIDMNFNSSGKYLMVPFNTLPLEGKYEFFLNKIRNNFYGFISFKKCYIFYQIWYPFNLL